MNYMAIYAVIEENTVTNVIVADSKEIAEEVTQKVCIEQTEENPLAIGWYFMAEHDKYVPVSPYTSWVYDGNDWVAPVAMPVEEGKYFTWNEETVSWDEFVIPEAPTDTPE
jgi:predicted P-loop ATPase/GTPase